MADLEKLGVLKSRVLRWVKIYTGPRETNLVTSAFDSLEKDIASDATRIGELTAERDDLKIKLQEVTIVAGQHLIRIAELEAQIASMQPIVEKKIEDLVEEVKPEINKLTDEVEKLKEEEEKEVEVLDKINDKLEEKKED